MFLSLYWLLAAQSMGPRPATAAAAAAAPVRGVPQYKYAAGVRNPQQHMTAQPQVSMQQVGCTFLLASAKQPVDLEILCLTF